MSEAPKPHDRVGHLEEVDGKGPAENTIGHGAKHMLVDAPSHVHQLANTQLEALPELEGTALLAGTEVQAFADLHMVQFESSFQKVRFSFRALHFIRPALCQGLRGPHTNECSKRQDLRFVGNDGPSLFDFEACSSSAKNETKRS